MGNAFVPGQRPAGELVSQEGGAPVIVRGGDFYVLALGQQELRLYRGTPRALEPVELAGLDLAAWASMPPRREPQIHTFLADRGGIGMRAVYRGMAGSGDRKDRVLQHFRGVDRALCEVLGEDGAPLVLAGVGYLQALYRAINSYPHLLDAGIDGSPGGASTDGMHRQAWSLVEPTVPSRRQHAVQRYRDLRGTGWTADTLEAAHAAAVTGRVLTLLVDEGACAARASTDGG